MFFLLLQLTSILADTAELTKSLPIQAHVFEINYATGNSKLNGKDNATIFALDKNGVMLEVGKTGVSACKPLDKKPIRVNGVYRVVFRGVMFTSNKLVVTRTRYNRPKELYRQYLVKHSE